MRAVRRRRKLSTVLFIALVVGAGERARGQMLDAPLAGSARVAFFAGYRPLQSAWNANVAASFAPFVDERWQLGIEPSLGVSHGPQQYHSYASDVSALANYLFLHGDVSRPYVGLYVAEDGVTGRPRITILGAQIGWLQFLTPSAAIRAELAYRHFSGGLGTSSSSAVTINLDPYLFGRASERLTALPSLGAVDVTGAIELGLTPNGSANLQAMVAPFLASWLQPGLSINADSHASTNLEGFARGYLPLSTRLSPFADVFGTANQNLNAHGARLGVRSYIARGVVLDVDWEWRNFDRSGVTGLSIEERRLRASLITEFGSRSR